MNRAPTSARTLVWTGRFPEEFAAGADGWSLAGAAFTAALNDAAEVVILDPLSFPWRELRPHHRELPLVVRLPEGLHTPEIIDLLGTPLLRHVTGADVLLCDDEEVRDQLSAAYDLDPTVWRSATQGWPVLDVSAAADKAHHYEICRLVATELRSVLGDKLPAATIGTVGRARSLNQGLRHRLRREILTYPPNYEQDPSFRPTPHACVVWLEDGGQTAVDRGAHIRGGFDLLHPGGRLLIVGYAVTSPGGEPNPSISQLIEEILVATGTQLHLDELRSIQFAGDHLSRGVLIGAASLATGKI